MNKKHIGVLVVSVLVSLSILWYLYTALAPGQAVAVNSHISIATSSIQMQIASTTPDPSSAIQTSRYVEVTNGCAPDYTGDCVNVRSGPGTKYPLVAHLRTGVVLKIGSSTTVGTSTWYTIVFAHDLLYPKRVTSDWYVSADMVSLVTDQHDHELVKGEAAATTTKRIVVDVSEQTLYAYDGDTLFMKEKISTGLEFTPTPRGNFTVFKMTPSRFMQGPIPGVSDQVYDLPGVPWNLYFTSGGAVIHGAYWHNHFGTPWSHGCVNLPPQQAKKLYYWADIGMKVTVQN